MTIAGQRLFANHALTAAGWADNVAIDIDGGRVVRIETGVRDVVGREVLNGPVVPALPNLHSHAFQRAMAGLAEVAAHTDDSFWTWREAMYRTVGLVSPEDVEAIAAKLFVELLKGGFGSVAEFHYLHQSEDGSPHADPAEMSRRIIAASARTGFGLTLLPVFYAHSNFGGAAPSHGQRRFIHDLDDFSSLLEMLRPACEDVGANLGLAIHSLRAATPAEITTLAGIVDPNSPIHIHVAEQQREVDDCLAATGRRPVDFLYDSADVNARWCLIHATHVTPDETRRMARSGAIVGLCPATEANLGDGIFPATSFLSEGGVFGIGTDSHVAVTVAEELRTLEYGQRLRDERRNRMAGPGASVGRTLFERALSGGARALGRDVGLGVGQIADLVVLDGDDPYIAAASGDQILDRWIFASLARPVRDVMVAGNWRIRDGRHADDEAIDRAFSMTLSKLANG